MRTAGCILVTGGAGYVGARLVPRLLDNGYLVKVFDLFPCGEEALEPVRGHPRVQLIRGDIRDEKVLKEAIKGADVLIHLAALSNDPGARPDPQVFRSVNFESFRPLIRLARRGGVRRFIFASSASVYGRSDELDVTEEYPHRPLTDYARYKSLSESVLWEEGTRDFTVVALRPGTVSGLSPRLRLDLLVNRMTSDAIHSGRITVYGGHQIRPLIHIEDMVELYLVLLGASREKIAGKVFNAAFENYTLSGLAQKVREIVLDEMPEKGDIEIVTKASGDPRSYHVSSEKVRNQLGFTPRHTTEDAIRDLVWAFRRGFVGSKIPVLG